MAKFRTWLEALAPQVLPQSLLGKAVHYTLGQWPKLTTFLTHGEVPLDNNRCENAIRPFVVARKGWLFSDTVKGRRRQRQSIFHHRDSQSQRCRTACLPVAAVRKTSARENRRGL